MRSSRSSDGTRKSYSDHSVWESSESSVISAEVPTDLGEANEAVYTPETGCEDNDYHG